MYRITGVVCALLAGLAIMLFVGDFAIEATSDIQNGFVEVYGDAPVDAFSCELCHPPGSFSELNPYGADLADAIVETGACLEFFPPNTHDISYGRCEYMHAEGADTPFSAGCTTCHGVELRGLIAPSCFTCHGVRWDEENPNGTPAGSAPAPHPAQQFDDAFAAIENIDSDGDGFTNIEEINAVSNPGSADSFPGGNTIIEVESRGAWRLDWIDDERNIEITIIEVGNTEVDMTESIIINGPGGRIFATQVSMSGDNILVKVPRALLYVLLGELTADTAIIEVIARNTDGDRLQTNFVVRISGKVPELVDDLRLSFDPRRWDGKEDVNVTIKQDTNQQINEGQPIMIFGPGGGAEMRDVERDGNKVTGLLRKADVDRIIGPRTVDGDPYIISVVGDALNNPAAAAKVMFLANRTVRYTGDGGGDDDGGDDCLDFDAPGGHTLARGECNYMHAPGLDAPFDNNCGLCHGSDLTGGSAPSCFLCHGEIWSSGVPMPKGGK